MSRPEKQSLLPKMDKKTAKQITKTLVKLIPDGMAENSSTKDSLIVYAITSGERSTQDVIVNSESLANVLRQRLSEIESGELTTDSIVELAISAEDWQRLVTGKLKQSLKSGQYIPLDVGVRIKRN